MTAPEGNHLAKLILCQSIISKTINVIQNQIGCDMKASSSPPTDVPNGPQAFYPGSNDRLVLLSGSKQALTLALENIIDTISFENKGADAGQTDQTTSPAAQGGTNAHTQMDIRFIVPNSAVSLIIGKGGSRIKQLRELSGAKIQVSTRDNNSRTDSERIINISGFKEQVRVATGMVVSIIQEDPVLKDFMGLNYPTRSVEPSFQASPGRHHQDHTGVGHIHTPEGAFIVSPTTGQPLPFNHLVLQLHTEIYLQIPDDYVGCLVGRFGQHLTEIRSCSGAKISISQRDQLVPGTRDRLVTVSGPFRSVHVAHLLIMQRLAEIQDAMQRNEMGPTH